MKNINKAILLSKIKKLFEENNINITACGCCDGYHIIINEEDLCSGSDFINDVSTSIKYYKDHQNKITVKFYEERFPKIEMIKVENKIVNLGGRSHPFSKYVKYLNNRQLLEFFKDAI